MRPQRSVATDEFDSYENSLLLLLFLYLLPSVGCLLSGGVLIMMIEPRLSGTECSFDLYRFYGSNP